MSAVAERVPPAVLVETTLGELAEYVTSGSRDWSKYYAGSGAIFIRTQDINRNKLSLDDVAYVRLPERVEGKRSLVRKGDLLITITGANVGKVAVVESEISEAYVSQSVCLVRLKDPNLAKFIQLQLVARKGDKSALEAMAYGLGRPVLNLENIRSVPVKAGPMHLRSGIVAEIEKQFSRLDEAVTALKRTRTQLDRYRASVRTAACTGLLVESDAKNWPQLALDKLVTIVQYGSSSKTSASGTGVPVLRMGNIVDGTLILGDLKYLPEDHDEFPALFLEPGDLLFNRTNSPELVGKSAVYQGQPVPCSFASYLIRLRFKPEVLPEFVACYLNSSLGRSWIKRVVSQQVGQANVNGSKLKALVIAVPPLELQRRIVAEVERSLSVAREAERQIDANLVRADRMRQAILAGAFSTKEDRETIRVRGSAEYA